MVKNKKKNIGKILIIASIILIALVFFFNSSGEKIIETDIEDNFMGEVTRDEQKNFPESIIQGYVGVREVGNLENVKITWIIQDGSIQLAFTSITGSYAIHNANKATGTLLFEKEGYKTFSYPITHEGGIRNIVVNLVET